MYISITKVDLLSVNVSPFSRGMAWTLQRSTVYPAV